ncbi:MFS transporter [Pseudomonas sp. PDM23]|uniref:MFS transporter n=1 Tax=unclassified Pseudomonas TaxID=196821 RepID=UPI00177CA11C|nr:MULTISPECIES: MFS transporter [unclassified Pseudomonas]MBD9577774.1 MFS transporter [Pseudomonas sp. PDM23]MBD9672335.1 MFS transporter [Pseudomonas sp. PDM21]
MPLAIWALAIGTFGIGTTEFVIAGLLPQMAAEYGITIPQAGYLATSYALGVFLGAPLLIILGGQLPRKRMLAILMVLFVLGNLMTAAATSFPMALLGRVITSLTHGAFIGIGSILAAELVAPNKRVSAIAFMFSGMALATLLGVPAGTWLSQFISWRATFYAITAIGIIGLLAVVYMIPDVGGSKGANVRQELAAFKNSRVLLAMGITVLGPASFFTSITYIAPMMTEVAGFSESAVVWLMMAFGIGLFAGNSLGGRFADRSLMPLLYITLLAQAIVLFVFAYTAHSQWMSVLCIALMAGFGFATVSPIQKLVLDKAAAAGAPTLAAAVNIGLFNLGNAIGAWVGGWVISAGFGLVAPNWAGGLLSLGALALALVSGALDRREAMGLPQQA